MKFNSEKQSATVSDYLSSFFSHLANTKNSTPLTSIGTSKSKSESNEYSGIHNITYSEDFLEIFSENCDLFLLFKISHCNVQNIVNQLVVEKDPDIFLSNLEYTLVYSNAHITDDKKEMQNLIEAQSKDFIPQYSTYIIGIRSLNSPKLTTKLFSDLAWQHIKGLSKQETSEITQILGNSYICAIDVKEYLEARRQTISFSPPQIRRRITVMGNMPEKFMESTMTNLYINSEPKQLNLT